MKNKLITLLTLLLIGAATAFSQSDRQLSVDLAGAVTDSASSTKIQFVSVVEDSRCPEDVDCIWAGRAIIKLTIKGKKGVSRSVELSTEADKNFVIIDGYKIHLASLTKKQTDQTGNNNYTAEFKIEKTSTTAKRKSRKR